MISRGLPEFPLNSNCGNLRLNQTLILAKYCHLVDYKAEQLCNVLRQHTLYILTIQLQADTCMLESMQAQLTLNVQRLP